MLQEEHVGALDGGRGLYPEEFLACSSPSIIIIMGNDTTENVLILTLESWLFHLTKKLI